MSDNGRPTEFEAILTQCRTPTPDVLAAAIDARTRVSRDEALALAYLAGFSHYGEAETVMDRGSLQWIEDTFTLRDIGARALHSKVVVHDLTHRYYGLLAERLAASHMVYRLRNRVNRKRAGGEYVTNLPARGELTYSQYLSELASHVPGLDEAVMTLQIPLEAEWALALHIATLPFRNTDENVRRHFLHADSVFAVNDHDPLYNLSVEHLRQLRGDLSHLTSPAWFVIANEDAAPLIRFLTDIGARHVMLVDPDQALTTFERRILDLQSKQLGQR